MNGSAVKGLALFRAVDSSTTLLTSDLVDSAGFSISSVLVVRLFPTALDSSLTLPLVHHFFDFSGMNETAEWRPSRGIYSLFPFVER